jgi:tetratricopeptide (TPR) repeat protein
MSYTETVAQVTNARTKWSDFTGSGCRNSCAVILLLFLCAAGAAQQPPPAHGTNLAAGIEALKAGDLDNAEQIFSEALRHGVRTALVFHNLGVIAQQRHNYTLAVNRFRQAIALQPEYAPSRLLLGVSLLALGKNAEAIPELQRAARSMPKESQAHLQLVKAYEASGNWIAAVEELQKLVNLNPQEPEYSYLLGRAWTRLSAWSYERLARLNPNSARLHQARGQDYAVQGKYELAVAAFQQAARSDPKLPEIHLALALLLLELKRADEARAEIDLELKLVPESKAALETRTKIEAAGEIASP